MAVGETDTRPLTQDDRRAITYGRSGSIDAAAFGDTYEVIPEFVPMSHHERDRIEMLTTVGRALYALPGTATHISRARVADMTDLDNAMGSQQYLPDEYFLAHGAYPCPNAVTGSNAGASMKFANPRYLDHTALESVTDDEERLDWLDTYARLGMHKQYEVADHFGLRTANGVESLVARTDYDWREKQQEGLRRRARTWKLLEAWGYDRATLATAFGVSYNTVGAAVRDKATDFVPPEQP